MVEYKIGDRVCLNSPGVWNNIKYYGHEKFEVILTPTLSQSFFIIKDSYFTKESTHFAIKDINTGNKIYINRNHVSFDKEYYRNEKLNSILS